MADACVPQPMSVEETFDFLQSNFELNYNQSRAPFPIFLHESWLKNSNRFEGFFKFLDWLATKDDVFVVSIQEVINWMRNPTSRSNYEQSKCSLIAPKSSCMAKGFFNGKSCEFKKIAQFNFESRYMTHCGRRCPKNYPWVGNPYGN